MKKHLVVTATLALSGLVLAGCAGGPDWQKPDATSQDLHRDKADCRVTATQADDDDVYDDCMKGRGWMED